MLGPPPATETLFAHTLPHYLTGITATFRRTVCGRSALAVAVSAEAIVSDLGTGKQESLSGTLSSAVRIRHCRISPHEPGKISPGSALRIALVLCTSNGTVRDGRWNNM